MTLEVDYSIVEPSRLIVTKRWEVTAELRREGGDAFYFLADPVRGKYFRLGVAEYEIFASLDGTKDLAEIAAATASRLGSQAFTMEQVVALARWFVDCGLAVTTATTAAARVANADERRCERRHAGWNPWFLRFSCGSPDKWLSFCRPIGDLIFRRSFFIAWCIVTLVALGIVLGEADELFRRNSLMLGPRGALQLLAAWCVLKLIHETAHGLACRHFGGRVGAWGVCLILGLPSPYIEVSSVWQFADKRKRVIVSLAGIYVELLVATAAVFVWALSGDAVIRQLALSVAGVAGAATLLFNLNPLMRFDGYFALTDWLGCPNLAAAASGEVRRVMRRHLLGIEDHREPSSRSRHNWLLLYGLASTAWRVCVAFGLLALCLDRFGGWAALLLSILPVSYAVRQAWRSVRRRRSVAGRVAINRFRLLRTYGVLAAAATAWVWLCDPREVEFPAVIEYRPLSIVRAITPGFVDEILVEDGAPVESGTAILRLRNDELQADLEQARNLVEQSTARSRMHRQAGEIAKEQAEAAKRKALESKLQKLRQQQEALVVRSPAAGRIVSRGLGQLLGRRVEEGTQIALIGDESQKEILAVVDQSAAALFESPLPQQITVELNGTHSAIDAADVQLDPRVELALLHPALSVEHGGTVAIVRRERPQADGKPITIEPEHAEPFLRLHGTLKPAEAARMQAGRTTTLYARTTWASLLSLSWSGWQRRLSESF